MTDWKAKLDAYLHDPPEKVLDLAWHKQRAEDYGFTGDAFHRPCDHTAAAADRLPWPHWRFLQSAFDGRDNHFKHPLGGAKCLIPPYSDADIAHHFASLNRPELAHGDDRARFIAHWRLWRWWASDQKDPRLAFLPADTRIPDHTIWTHNSIVSALQACVVDGRCQPAFLLFQIGPVQDYIAQARRTLDLWSGSYLLSYLIAAGLKHIALNYGPDNVIFPNLCGQPIFDRKRSPGYMSGRRTEAVGEERWQ
jgi:CRISPR-associated protein Cmr2